MIGIVVVSHSRALGNAAAALAVEMVPESARPQLAVAAGLDETTFGTDAAAIADAIGTVDSGDGVLVVVDLGSAILSAEMALEFVDPEIAARTRISSGALVEGLVAAVVTASTGASLGEVLEESVNGLVGKQEQLNSNDVVDQACLGGVPPRRSRPDDDSTDESQESNAGPQRTFEWTIRNVHGLHARPAAALVSGLRAINATVLVANSTSGKGPVPATSLTSIQTLGLRKGDIMVAQISGPDADVAYSRLTEMAQTDFGELPSHGDLDAGRVSHGDLDAGREQNELTRYAEDKEEVEVRSAEHGSTVSPCQMDNSSILRTNQLPVIEASGEVVTETITASTSGRTGRQIVIGEAHHMDTEPDTSGYVAGDRDTEQVRLSAAVDVVRTTLKSLERGENPDIYQVQELMLDDVVPQLKQGVADGQSAVDTVRDTFTRLAQELEELDDPYLRARAEDQRGLQRMMLRALMGLDVVPTAARGILIVKELDPATAGALDPQMCWGIITTSGGATGHGAILAQARGFALLTGREEAARIPEGTVVAIDPVEEKLWINPSEQERTALTTKQAQRQTEAEDAARKAHEPARTQSGRRILVEANIASLQDAHDAQKAGAEGSGLVRTEVLFGTWDHAPTAEEQADIFIQIGKILDNPITIRTWDPGGDKPLPFLYQDPEANPMLGERGIRAMKRLPYLLDEQLTAILLASREIDVRVMFPMITLPEEMVWARSRLAPILATMGGSIEVGMMVETPAAAVRAVDFLDVADFISVGTNDLTQYTMAVDRGNPQVADVAKGPNTAVWDLISMAGRAFAGRPVAVCGDLASHPDLASRLIEAGVTELSVRAPLVGVVKQAVRQTG